MCLYFGDLFLVSVTTTTKDGTHCIHDLLSESPCMPPRLMAHDPPQQLFRKGECLENPEILEKIQIWGMGGLGSHF